MGAVSALVSVFVPPLAPALWAINIGISAATAIQSGSVGGFIGGLVGGAIFGGIGQQFAIGVASGMGQGAYSFLGGAIGGAAEFGLSGFGAGFGATLASGGSFRDAFRSGGYGAAAGAAFGAAIQGSYMAGWQESLHGYSVPAVGLAQGNAALNAGQPGQVVGVDSAVRARTRGKWDLYLHGTNAEGAAGISASRKLSDWSWVTKPYAIDPLTGKMALMLNPAQYRAFTGTPGFGKGEFFALLVAPNTSAYWRDFTSGGAPQWQIYGQHTIIRGPYKNPNP